MSSIQLSSSSDSSILDMSHLSYAARKAIQKNLYCEIFQTTHLFFTDIAAFSLKGRRLVLKETNGKILEASLSESQSRRVFKAFSWAMGQIRNTQKNALSPHLEASELISAARPLFCKPPASTQQFVMGPLCEGLFLSKKMMQAMPSMSGSMTLEGMGVATGIVGFGLGVVNWHAALKDNQKAIEIQDGEGRRRSGAKIIHGQLQTAAALLFLTEKGCALASPTRDAAIASAAFGPVAAVFAAIASSIGITLSLLGIVRCKTFQDRMNLYLENPHFTAEQRTVGALRYLQSLLSLSPEEVAFLSSKYSGEALEREAEKWVETKIRYLKRRTSVKSLWMVLSQSEAILHQIEDPALRSTGLQKGAALLSAVQRESKVKTTLYTLGLVASLLGLAALITSTTLSVGALPLALSITAASLLLGLALYAWVADRKKWSSDEGVASPSALETYF